MAMRRPGDTRVFGLTPRTIWAGLRHGDSLKDRMDFLRRRPWTGSGDNGTFNLMDRVGAWYFRNDWEPAVIGELTRTQCRTFFDVGANIGFYSVMMARRCEFVLALEPSPANFAFLERNLKRNLDDKGIHNTKAVLCAASDENGRAGLSGKADTTRLVEGDTVKTMRLDDLAAQFDVRPDLMKIDTEGHEMRVLEGARGILAGGALAVVESFNADEIRAFAQRNNLTVRQLDWANWVLKA